jgi:hypothetical protein
MADDQDFKNFMAKYETPDDDIDDIMNAADALLGGLTGLTFNGEAADDNPYRRTKKAPKLKNYNQPDPSFDFLNNMNLKAASPLNPNKGPKVRKPKKPTSAKAKSKAPLSSKTKTGFRKSIKTGKKTGSPYGANLLKKMGSPKGRNTGKKIDAFSPSPNLYNKKFGGSKRQQNRTVEPSKNFRANYGA